MCAHPYCCVRISELRAKFEVPVERVVGQVSAGDEDFSVNYREFCMKLAWLAGLVALTGFDWPVIDL